MPTAPVEAGLSRWRRLARHGLRAFDGQTLRLTWPLLALAPALLLLVSIGLLIQGIGQIVVGNGARWERAQQGAVISLGRYADSCDPVHFQAYQADMAVLKAFETARGALFAPNPDLATARAAYERIGLTAWESLLLVQVMPRLQSHELHAQASAIWQRVKADARDIDQHAQQLHQAVLRGCSGQHPHSAALALALAAHDRVAPMRRAFDAAASLARWRLGMVLLGGMALLALPITLAGYLLTARLQRRASAAAQALAASEQRLQQALTGSGHGLWELPLPDGSVTCSATMMAMLGHAPRERALGFDEFQQLLHPEDRPAFLQQLSARGADGERLVIELRMQHHDQRWRWLRLAGQLAPSPAGQALRMIGSAADVTERRALQQAIDDELALRRSALQSLRTTLAQLDGTEGASPVPAAGQPQDEIRLTAQALARVGAQLREANERLQAILALSPDGFVSFDQAQCIGLASPALHRLTGLDTAPLQGQSAAAFFAQLQALCRPGAPTPSLQALQACTADEPMTLDLATRPPRTLSLELRAGSHPLVRHVLCVRDVTHQREVERLKSEFITVAAHELRTPMTVIYGYVEMLMNRRLQQAAREELQAVIYRQCRLMMSIMDDLMDLGRLEAHHDLGPRLAPVDLGALLRSTAAALPLPPGRQPPKVRDAEPWPDATVAGDADHLVRLLNNVLGNAYKYSPEAGPVEIALTRQTMAGGVDEVCISIADHGIGMTPEQMARVGERFYRADASGHIPGTGLGMSIVGEIARLHGGQVKLHSTPGEGTRVDICLPAWRPPGPGADVPAPAPARQAQPLSTPC